METTPATCPGLYADLLGPRWHELAEAVRNLHPPNKIVRAAGTFRVRRGGRVARLLAWFARMPAECEAADLQLTVTPTPQGELWHRVFAGQPLPSRQWASCGLLVEHLGLGEIHLQLEVSDGALHYLTKRVALRLGPLRLPLPRWLAPRVTASEKPDGNVVQVSVEVVLPLIGLLIAYDGPLTILEAKPC